LSRYAVARDVPVSHAIQKEIERIDQKLDKLVDPIPR
jgi:hypothetical protein